MEGNPHETPKARRRRRDPRSSPMFTNFGESLSGSIRQHQLNAQAAIATKMPSSTWSKFLRTRLNSSKNLLPPWLRPPPPSEIRTTTSNKDKPAWNNKLKKLVELNANRQRTPLPPLLRLPIPNQSTPNAHRNKLLLNLNSKAGPTQTQPHLSQRTQEPGPKSQGRDTRTRKRSRDPPRKPNE